MSTRKLKGKDLRKIGYRDNTIISLAIGLAAKHYKKTSKDERLEILLDVKENPEAYEGHPFMADLAVRFTEKIAEQNFDVFELEEEPKTYKVYGKKFISNGAIDQMDLAMRLPVAKAGALMPDCHVGYGLPVGGVLATENQVVPYAVGLDIGCRMSMTILDCSEGYFNKNKFQFKKALKEETFFGTGQTSDLILDHEVLDSDRFKESELLNRLHGKAVRQLGTSGSGNHFVEFGEITLSDHNSLGLDQGSYMAILSHSGSRGLGATLAQYFTKVAMDKCRLPNGAQNLAWLDLDSPEGLEYWMAMNLAGDYAKACHDVIHQRLLKSLGLKKCVVVENHHNFAWKENVDGQDLIVHRKGATPAQKGVLGIIPGSMTAPGYLVSGKGNVLGLNSASHGAGRKMSRKKAKENYTNSALKKYLKEQKVELIGGGVDEAPIAFKDIEQVMLSQKELVAIEGRFSPKMVRMNKE